MWRTQNCGSWTDCDSIRETKQQQYYDPFSYKDTQIKTFYTGYVQKKYEIANQPFPERNTLTINIKNEINMSRNNEASLCKECGNLLRQSRIIDNTCPGCGKTIRQSIQ